MRASKILAAAAVLAFTSMSYAADLGECKGDEHVFYLSGQQITVDKGDWITGLHDGKLNWGDKGDKSDTFDLKPDEHITKLEVKFNKKHTHVVSIKFFTNKDNSKEISGDEKELSDPETVDVKDGKITVFTGKTGPHYNPDIKGIRTEVEVEPAKK